MKQAIIGSIIAVLLSVGFTLYHNGSSTTVVNNPLGAVSGPEVYGNDFTVGNVHRVFGGVRLTTATTTVCAIKSSSATSTLVVGTVNFTVSSTTASTVTLAKATSAFATTTSLGTITIVANGTAAAQASTTPTSGSAQIFAPNNYFVVGMAGNGGNAGAFSPTGSCTAVFQDM